MFQVWREGHVRGNCPKLKDGKSDDEANIIRVCGSGEDGLVLSITTDKMFEFFDKLICPYHMCGKREWFVTYETLKKIVFLGAGSPLQVVGMGIVCFEMYDGKLREFMVHHIYGKC